MKISKIKSILAAIFLAVSFSSFTNICAGPKDFAFLKEIADSYPKEGHNCPTLAYLQNDFLRKKMIEEMNTKEVDSGNIRNLNVIIKNIIDREMSFQDTHYVFYHGQSSEFSLLYDLYNALYKIFNEKEYQDFLMLRFVDDRFQNFLTKEHFFSFFDKEIKRCQEQIEEDFENKPEEDYQIFDHITPVRSVLLAVNPSLFGNYGNTGESAFSFFMSIGSDGYVNDSVMFCDLEDGLNDWLFGELEKIFRHFGLEKYFEGYVKEFDTFISNEFFDQVNNMLQIFIPKKNCSSIAYESYEYGEGIPNEFKNKITPNIDLILKNHIMCLKNTIYDYENAWDSIQCRLLINKEVLLNPESGVKIFRYCNEPEKFESYKKKFNVLIQKIEKDVKSQFLGNTRKKRRIS